MPATRKNRRGQPCAKCGVILTEKNSRIRRRNGSEELKCLRCAAQREAARRARARVVVPPQRSGSG